MRLPGQFLLAMTARCLSEIAHYGGDRYQPGIELAEMSAHGPSVWTGRALQGENDDLEKVGLALLYPAHDGAFELLAIMDIRARSISFASRPRRPYGPPDRERAGGTFLHLLFPTRRPQRESQLLLSGST
jgi:hypothetical protein